MLNGFKEIAVNQPQRIERAERVLENGLGVPGDPNLFVFLDLFAVVQDGA